MTTTERIKLQIEVLEGVLAIMRRGGTEPFNGGMEDETRVLERNRARAASTDVADWLRDLRFKLKTAELRAREEAA